MTNGKGGSYMIDPKTGEPVLVASTAPSEDEQARDAANQAARDKETADVDAAVKAEKKAADQSAKSARAIVAAPAPDVKS